MTLKAGPMKASFSGKVTLFDLNPPNGNRITGEGSGGVAGFAKGGAAGGPHPVAFLVGASHWFLPGGAVAT